MAVATSAAIYGDRSLGGARRKVSQTLCVAATTPASRSTPGMPEDLQRGHLTISAVFWGLIRSDYRWHGVCSSR